MKSDLAELMLSNKMEKIAVDMRCDNAWNGMTLRDDPCDEIKTNTFIKDLETSGGETEIYKTKVTVKLVKCIEASMHDDICDDWQYKVLHDKFGHWCFQTDHKAYIEFALKSAKSHLAEVRKKIKKGERGYDDITLRALKNKVQGLKATLKRLESEVN